jgi:DNA-binding response OmpR family regulator
MKKILVVNNDNDTMTLLKNWLEKKAYTVRYTSSHDEVPGIMKEFKPGLVLVDVMQKDAADTIKKNRTTAKIPVLLMTGYTSRPVNSQVPADDRIEKPFNLTLLEKKIERLTEK